jgi:hypothetical protein
MDLANNDFRARHRYWQERVQPRRPRRIGRGRFAATCEKRNLDRHGCEAPTLHRRDGSLLRRSSSWAALRMHGHKVRLMSPEYVRPYIKAQKSDDRDAEGIAESATRPTMRFVELKTQDALDMQTLHRARDRLIGDALH